ncbi:PglZ domain-containing protein [Vulcanococcus limneticus Candia 3F8]|uniref:PglZ domain-containing protein n=1 Tax=Vulcanococcus limneticus TaxID=2170428 RepID=UPI0020CF2460|nr:PglZ domain-containing protein [Vulcanococcus limneticus]MCP9793564.1 PglZ domain-containing protein [Vulcanococcus limneticus MW73D5]MCP9895379.1 PglZ domain-containing protein [Vulcanococcus limneticus Candia 3F8]MCP9898979.1 PglZ domain-containing protein [Vulcanococcus limneticus Candia 3B3]
MIAAAPNKLQARFCQELSRQLSLHRVVLLFDPVEQLRSLLDALATSQPTPDAPGGLNLGELQAQWLIAGSSLFALRHQLEPLVCADQPDPLLVYLPQRQEADGRATLLELIRAGTVFEAQLVKRARVYLREVMEPDKVEQLLKRPDLTYRDIAIALEQSGEGGFSQLKALFRQQLGGMGSPPENAELARLWLASDQFDAGISAKGLQSELQDLLHSRWGLGFPAEATLADWRQRAQRALLLHEFLHDWHGDELTAFAKQSLPVGKAAEENTLTDVKALRRNHASAYIAIAARVEETLGLRELISHERPGVLGAIDTFPCEEQFLLRSVDAFLAKGEAVKAQELVQARQGSFWLVGQPTDPIQSQRRLQWDLARTAAALGLALDQAEAQLPRPTAPDADWLAYQADVAHHVDGLQRRMEQQVADLSAAVVEVAQGLEQLRTRYEQLLDKQTRRFTDALQQAGWLIPGALPQTRIWAERVQPGAGRAVVFWVDALRYEMGASLHERFSGWSREQLSDLKLDIAQAALPSITPVGMAALLPGAERGFAVTEGDGEPCSVIDGVPVGWSNDKPKRLAHLQQRVPAAVVLNLVEVIRSKDAVLLDKLGGNGPVVITSIGIDEAGERDSDERLANVRADMQRELDTIEEAVRRLAALPLDHRLERFVITADHGYLHLPLGREPAMRIPAPAGKTFKLERRCWLGHPSAVQEPCIEIPPADLGYGSNGLSVVVPRSAGVFKAGGSLCYHHGGTSPQEVLIPLLSFRCNPAGAAPDTDATAAKGKRSKHPAWPGALPETITNRILMLPIELPVTLLNQGESRQLVLAAYDSKSDELVATPIQAIGAELDTGTNRLTLTLGQTATIGLMLPAEVSAKKLYLELRDAATDLVLHKSPELPVDLIG